MTIDVWDVATFDSALAAQLAANADVIRDYLHTDHQIFLSHDLGRGGGRVILRPENPYADDFYALKDTIGTTSVKVATDLTQAPARDRSWQKTARVWSSPGIGIVIVRSRRCDQFHLPIMEPIMTPTRLRECLQSLHWPTTTLAEVLRCEAGTRRVLCCRSR